MPADFMPDAARLRIGIVGAGSIVRQRHLPGLRAVGGVDVVAVANSTPDSAKRFLSEEGIGASVFSHWQELVASPDIDIVWIGAHPDLHEPVTVAALSAGKHVFCQARMARDLTEAGRMLAAAKAVPHLVTMLCPPPYGLRQDAFIRQLLRENVVGKIQELKLESHNGAFLDSGAPAHWRQKRESSGRNVMTLGIHTEILQRWFGRISWVEAHGEVKIPMRCGRPVDIPDFLEVRAGFEAGPIADWSFSNVHAGPAVEALTVCGEGGELRIDYLTEEIRLERAGERTSLETPAELGRPWRVEADFIQAVRDSNFPRPRPTFEDGVAYMAVVHAVEDARLSGKRIPVAE